MKRFITFWKNEGHEALRGRTAEIFKVSWDEDSNEWVKKEDGPYWGMYKLDTDEVRRLNRPPENMGALSDEEGYPILIPGVDHLEAEDVTVTPEGLDLGEEEPGGEESESDQEFWDRLSAGQ